MVFHDTEKTFAVVDLAAIEANYRTACAKTHGAFVFAVVKADAYGHGAVPVAKRLEKAGCPGFAVSNINEALELRENGIRGKILVLGYVLDEHLPLAIEKCVSLAVDTPEHLRAIADAADGRDVFVHIKLGTGMNRTGFDVTREAYPADLAKAVRLFGAYANLHAEGVFSHFAAADETDGSAFTHLQYARFRAACDVLKAHGVAPTLCHIANSAGIDGFPETHENAARVGITLYGGTDDPAYIPAMSFFTTVVNVHRLPKGESVSYGRTYTAPEDRLIAVIGAGYADGFRRCFSNGKGYVKIRGKNAPVLGRVCMDMTMVDVTDIPDVRVGDRVLLFGRDGDDVLPVTVAARAADTISYELMCGVSKRVPRSYR